MIGCCVVATGAGSGAGAGAAEMSVTELFAATASTSLFSEHPAATSAPASAIEATTYFSCFTANLRLNFKFTHGTQQTLQAYRTSQSENLSSLDKRRLETPANRVEGGSTVTRR
jgi:hypothetical protein